MKGYFTALAGDSVGSVVNSGLSAAENTDSILKPLLIGIAIVFLVLIVILIRLIAVTLDFKRTAAGGNSDTGASATSGAGLSQPHTTAGSLSDEETLAVITAAIAMIYASENHGDATATGFRVVSFKAVDKVKPWTKA